jgi:hypothetical protein
LSEVSLQTLSFVDKSSLINHAFRVDDTVKPFCTTTFLLQTTVAVTTTMTAAMAAAAGEYNNLIPSPLHILRQCQAYLA